MAADCAGLFHVGALGRPAAHGAGAALAIARMAGNGCIVLLAAAGRGQAELLLCAVFLGLAKGGNSSRLVSLLLFALMSAKGLTFLCLP
jgi:hypothetical protein